MLSFWCSQGWIDDNRLDRQNTELAKQMQMLNCRFLISVSTDAQLLSNLLFYYNLQHSDSAQLDFLFQVRNVCFVWVGEPLVCVFSVLDFPNSPLHNSSWHQHAILLYSITVLIGFLPFLIVCNWVFLNFASNPPLHSWGFFIVPLQNKNIGWIKGRICFNGSNPKMQD